MLSYTLRLVVIKALHVVLEKLLLRLSIGFNRGPSNFSAPIKRFYPRSFELQKVSGEKILLPWFALREPTREDFWFFVSASHTEITRRGASLWSLRRCQQVFS